MLVPGANVDGIAIALTHHVLNRNIGKGANPIRFKKEVPVVVFAEQGITPANRNEALVGAIPGGLAADGPGDFGILPPFEGLDEPIRDNKPRRIGHVIIALDISSSMAESSGASYGTSKLIHIQEAIKTLIDNGIPKGTHATLIIYSDKASIARSKTNEPMYFTADLATLIKTIQSQITSGSTNFGSVIDLTSNVVSMQEQVTGIKPSDGPSLFILITDGQRTSGPPEIEVLENAQTLREKNLHSLLIGTGPDYDERFLSQLNTVLGPSLCIHTPHANPRINVFEMFVPTFADDIRNEHYMSVVSRGFTLGDKFFDLIPTIKHAPETTGKEQKYTLWTGYQSKCVGVGFVNKRLLGRAKLDLLLQQHAGGNIEHRVEIPILPFPDAGAYHEHKIEAEEAVARLLAYLAQREWDADAYDRTVADFPSAFDPNEAKSISQMLHRSVHIDNNETRGSVSDASMSHSVRSRGDYSKSLVDFRIPDALGLHSGQIGPLDLPVEESIGPLQNVDPNAYDNAEPQLPREAFHSGQLGPLDLEPPDQLKSFQAGAITDYNRPDTPKITLIFDPTFVELNGKDALSFKGGKIVIGRHRDCNVIIKKEGASRVHCQIILEDDKPVLIDATSTNGTYLNGELTTHKELKDGDVIKIADVELRVKIL